MITIKEEKNDYEFEEDKEMLWVRVLREERGKEILLNYNLRNKMFKI